MPILDNLSTEDKEYIEDLKNELKSLNIRLNKDSKEDLFPRNVYQRDYTRIIYSSSFRRLQGKMQLLGMKNDQFYRNRLTHSLEVSQIARSIAEDLGYTSDEIYVVEACSLCHDIGNPPFGHYGEKILNQLSNDIGGFEGNAQTLRVIMDLEKKIPNIKGLNLTLRTLLGVTKYFNVYENSHKFIYHDSYNILKDHIDSKKIKIRTLDVQIIDLADEIAYAAHDLEDALSLKLFSIDELLYEFKLNESIYPNAYDELKDIVKKSNDYAIRGNLYNSSEEFSFLFRKDLTSKIVHKLIHDISLIKLDESTRKLTGSRLEKELGFTSTKSLVKGLKTITFNCINRRDCVKYYENQGKKIITGLYDVFFNYDCYLPVEYRLNNIEKASEHRDYIKKRKIIDYIAGMMDSFAISTYLKFYGQNSLDSIYTSGLMTIEQEVTHNLRTNHEL